MREATAFLKDLMPLKKDKVYNKMSGFDCLRKVRMLLKKYKVYSKTLHYPLSYGIRQRRSQNH